MLSLTFDDGLPGQLRNAIPEMNARSIKGTFFLIGNQRMEHGWSSIALDGHEVGNHGMSHRWLDPRDTPWEIRQETHTSKAVHETNFRVPVTSFGYPYGDAPDQLRAEVADAGHSQARASGERNGSYLIRPDSIDWYRLPSMHVGTNTNLTDMATLIKTAMADDVWVILTFHAIGNPEGFDNVTTEWFQALLDLLCASRDSGLAIATINDAAQWIRETF